MFLGRPTGSAMPLMWAHAEYIKLLRSVADGRVFDLIPEVAERFLSGRNTRHRIEVWKHNRQVSSIRQNSTLFRFVCTGRPMSGTPSMIPRRLGRRWELTLWMSRFP
jgi:hypothetical protein